ncbi:hypothetical protein MSG28_004460 [Choristoneura fumiferana]|uniref:Uncharacterized protein n=1 Tax=Choristoneura fumiferana TaxID=7141 RepID=A0ACC0K662_CHOFU|nr:hypothetical protein MSG28_004460 [Choristoneura fumiferana]
MTTIASNVNCEWNPNNDGFRYFDSFAIYAIYAINVIYKYESRYRCNNHSKIASSIRTVGHIPSSEQKDCRGRPVAENCRLGSPAVIDTRFYMASRVKNQTYMTSHEPGSSRHRTKRCRSDIVARSQRHRCALAATSLRARSDIVARLQRHRSALAATSYRARSDIVARSQRHQDWMSEDINCFSAPLSLGRPIYFFSSLTLFSFSLRISSDTPQLVSNVVHFFGNISTG